MHCPLQYYENDDFISKTFYIDISYENMFVNIDISIMNNINVLYNSYKYFILSLIKLCKVKQII